jgi:hypothetical protein
VGAASVVRPWAERLADALRPRPGERILDLSWDGGVLSRRLARAVGPGGAVITPQAESPWLVPGPPLDAATSLLSLQLAADPAAHLAELLGALRTRGGRLAVIVQLCGEGSPHESAVLEALGEALARPATLSGAELEALSGRLPLSTERLRDVVRFDGVGQLWTALVTERGIAAELDARRRSALETALDRWIAADGTLRIAVEAIGLFRATGPGSPGW